jgi:hypothetical protein
VHAKLHRASEFANARSQTQQIVSRNARGQVCNRQLDIVDSRALDAKHIALVLVCRLDELVERPASVVRKFLEKRLGFFFCEGPHDGFCFDAVSIEMLLYNVLITISKF